MTPQERVNVVTIARCPEHDFGPCNCTIGVEQVAMVPKADYDALAAQLEYAEGMATANSKQFKFEFAELQAERDALRQRLEALQGAARLVVDCAGEYVNEIGEIKASTNLFYLQDLAAALAPPEQEPQP